MHVVGGEREDLRKQCLCLLDRSSPESLACSQDTSACIKFFSIARQILHMFSSLMCRCFCVASLGRIPWRTLHQKTHTFGTTFSFQSRLHNCSSDFEPLVIAPSSRASAVRQCPFQNKKKSAVRQFILSIFFLRLFLSKFSLLFSIASFSGFFQSLVH